MNAHNGIIAALLLSFALCGLQYGCGKEAPKGGDILYVLAPETQLVTGTSALPLEAALRAVAVEVAAGGHKVVYMPVDQLQNVRIDAYPRLVWRPGDTPGERKFKAVFLTSAADNFGVADAAFDVGSWKALSRSVADARDAIAAALPEEWKPPAPEKRQSGAGPTALAAVFDRLCGDGLSAAQECAAEIDKALGADPWSSDARLAACWPAAMLGTGDLYGRFQLRDRWLALPVSWWAAATRTGPCDAPRATLTEAWLALLCGFPGEALEIVAATEGAGDMPLGRALRIFATRDWRALDAERATDATAVEQLAWLWAIQQCDLGETSADTAERIMLSRGLPEFGYMQNIAGVDAGHVFTVAMMDMAAKRALSVVCSLEAIPTEARKTLAADIDRARAPQAVAAAGEATPMWAGAPVTETMRLVAGAFTLALKAPDGPLVQGPDGARRWQSTPPWGYAQPLRGAVYQSADMRARFLHIWLGFSDDAVALLKALADGAEPTASARHFFSAALAIVGGDGRRSADLLAELMRTEMGSRPSQWAFYQSWCPPDWLEYTRRWLQIYPQCCGAFASESLFETAADKPDQRRREWYSATVASDPYNRVRAWADLYEPSAVRQVARLLPYQPYVIQRLGNSAVKGRRFDDAVALYRAAIQVAPESIVAYRALAEAYVEAGKRAEGLEALRQGCTKAGYSVTTANAMSRLARLLVEDGHFDEAAKWAAAAAKSGSRAGYVAMANVLHASGRVSEAVEAERMAAIRDEAACQDYILYAFRCGVPIETIRQDARRLAEVHPSFTGALQITFALAMCGESDLAMELLDGPLKIEDQGAWNYFYGVALLTKGEPITAAQRFRDSIARQYLFVYKSVDPLEGPATMYVAGCLAYDEELRTAVLQNWASLQNPPPHVTTVIDCVNGKITEEEALRKLADESRAAMHLAWIKAAQAESKGRDDIALSCYRLAASLPRADDCMPGRFARRRIAALERKYGAPAERPKAEAGPAPPSSEPPPSF